MPTYSSAVVEKITRNDSDLGARWLESIAPPHARTSTHQALLDGIGEFPKRASRSFGHRLDSRSTVKPCDEAMLPMTKWVEDFAPDLEHWNVKVTDGIRRLHIMDQERVGAVSCVARRGLDGSPYITVMGGPVVTPVDTTNVNNHGAPTWCNYFEPRVWKKYIPDDVDHIHAVVASAAGFTRDKVPETISNLMEDVDPVILTPGTRFGERVTHQTNDGTKVMGPFKALLLPMYCDPPVGLYFPTNIGYDGFYDAIHGQKPYGAFARLLRDNAALFKEWFAAAKGWDEQMVLNAYNALPLWFALPNPQNVRSPPDDIADTVAPFQFQRMRFLWRYYCDAVCCGASSSPIDESARVAFVNFLKQVDPKLPRDLGWTHLPASDFPFVHRLFKMSAVPEVRRWLMPFIGEDGPTEVPTTALKKGSTDLSPRAHHGQSNIVSQQDRVEDSSDDDYYPRKKKATSSSDHHGPRSHYELDSDTSRTRRQPSRRSKSVESERRLRRDDRSRSQHSARRCPSRSRSMSPDPRRGWGMVTDDRPKHRRERSPTWDYERQELRRSPRQHVGSPPPNRAWYATARDVQDDSSPESFSRHSKRLKGRYASAQRHLQYDDDDYSRSSPKRRRKSSWEVSHSSRPRDNEYKS